MIGKNETVCFRGRNVAESSKWHQEMFRLREVVKVDGYLVRYRFASKIYSANNLKNNLRLESTPMVW